MRNCEARTVMRWPKDRRQSFYAKVLKHRGKTGLNDLKERVNEQWKIKCERNAQDVLELQPLSPGYME